MEQLNDNIRDNLNIETLISLYNNNISIKDKNLELLNQKIKFAQKKLDNMKKENELIKEQNYNYKILNEKNFELSKKINKKKNKNNNKDKYISTIDEDNINNIKNELLSKIIFFYNKLYKLINQTNKDFIDENIDIDNLDDLIELEKRFKFIEDNINKI